MKYLLSNTMRQSTDVATLKILLQKEDIPCLIRNEHLSMAEGEIPLQECLPELWVLNDGDYSRAYELVETWRNSPVVTHSQWLCAGCGETLESQFTSCWKCGARRDEA